MSIRARPARERGGVLTELHDDGEWGRRDLNPDRRVSPTRGATHACCCEPWVSAPVCHHRNQQTRFAIKPMTGARNSTRLNYVPMGLRTRGTATGISKFASRVGRPNPHPGESFTSVTEPLPLQRLHWPVPSQ